MKIEVKLFAVARQLAGRESVPIELPEEATVADVRAAIRQQHPALSEVVGHGMIAVDTAYVGDDAPVKAGSEVACIPPVSGG